MPYETALKLHRRGNLELAVSPSAAQEILDRCLHLFDKNEQLEVKNANRLQRKAYMSYFTMLICLLSLAFTKTYDLLFGLLLIMFLLIHLWTFVVCKRIISDLAASLALKYPELYQAILEKSYWRYKIRLVTKEDS